MGSGNACLLFILGCCFCGTGVVGQRFVRVAQELQALSPLVFDENNLYQRLEFWVETHNGVAVTPVGYGDLEIEFIIETSVSLPMFDSIEPGFDFTPDIGPLPATFTLTVKEGQSESNRFVLQILDDCHRELVERMVISAAGLRAYTNVGTYYDFEPPSDSEMIYEVSDGSADTERPLEIVMDPEFPTVGFITFESDTSPKFRVKGLECNRRRTVPIADTCTAMLAVSSQPSMEITFGPLDSFFILDASAFQDSDVEDPELIMLRFDTDCTGTTSTPMDLDNTVVFRATIIDDDGENSYGIVYPASIAQKESRGVSVYDVTSQLDIPTGICRNARICPYTAEMPLCKSTDLERAGDTFGQCTVFPKPKRQSLDRFGSYILTAEYETVQTIPVFIRGLSDVLNPRRGPTITINNMEDIDIGVHHSDFVRELRWWFHGKELIDYRGSCNIKIKEATYGVHDGYYEVTRSQRKDSGYKAIIRLIIRRCPDGKFYVDTTCLDASIKCYNGGVLRNGEERCECPEGFYGLECETVWPYNLRVGPLSKELSCRDIDEDIPPDCKGALFCFHDPLGCRCARGYWGPKCDRVCAHGRFGWSCLEKCRCSGPWEACDPKTGICKAGCADGYRGPNCQQEV